MKKLLISLIDFYQVFISVTFFRGVCKYELSCSEYTKQKIDELGVIQGSWLGLKRIGSCR